MIDLERMKLTQLERGMNRLSQAVILPMLESIFGLLRVVGTFNPRSVLLLHFERSLRAGRLRSISFR
jgi:hypothetical protein